MWRKEMMKLIIYLVLLVCANGEGGLHLIPPPSRHQLAVQFNLSSEKPPEEHTSRGIASNIANQASGLSKGFFDFFRRYPGPPPRRGPMLIPYPGSPILRPLPLSPHSHPLPHLNLAAPASVDRTGGPNLNEDSLNRVENGFFPSKRLHGNPVSQSLNSSRIYLTPPPALCDFYTDSLCIESHPYPYSEMQRSFPMELPALRRLLADVQQQNADVLTDGVSIQDEALYTFEHYYGSGENNTHSYKDYAADGGFVCPSDIRYVRPKRARNPRGQWKSIVNLRDQAFTQTIRIEKCLKPFSRCSYVFSYLNSECIQIYNYQRLASWDEKRGFHMDVYKIPTSCSCHLRSSSNLQPTSPVDNHLTTNHTMTRQEVEQKAHRKAHNHVLQHRSQVVKPNRILPDMPTRNPHNYSQRNYGIKQAIEERRGSEPANKPPSNRFQPQIGHRNLVPSAINRDRVNFEVNPVSDYMHTWGR